jgi:hypothetical protein
MAAPLLRIAGVLALAFVLASPVVADPGRLSDPGSGPEARLAPADCHPEVPNPILVFEGRTLRSPDVNPYYEYDFDVQNWYEFPAEYFAPAPDLPPCGLNTSAARAWVDIYRANGQRLYGFCAFESPEDLRRIWFTLPASEPPPDVYILIKDRECNLYHYSNVVSTITPNLPPRAYAGADRVVECASSAGTAVTLDGSLSYDPEQVPLTHLWSAPGVTFDDPTSATPTGLFPSGQTTVYLVVSDGVYQARDTVQVEVVDTTPPTLSVELSPSVLWPPNHELINVHATVHVEDLCDANATFVLDRIETLDAGGDGGDPDGPDVTGADQGTADVDCQLRAERSGAGEGRRYALVYRATDGAGNVVEATAFVEVPHDLGKHAADRQAAGRLAGTAACLALAGPRSNPSVGGLSIEFSLPDASPASLEVLDLSGRRLVVREVGGLGPGSHVVGLEETRALPAGIYLVRLRHAQGERIAKAVIVR